VELNTEYPQTARMALHGVSKFMLCPPNTEDRVEVAKLLIQAAVDTGSVTHIGLVSVMGAERCETLLQKQFRSIELFLEHCGVAFTVFRCPTLMDNFKVFAPQILQGQLSLPPIGDTTLIAATDVGECAAAVLTSQDSTHERKYYTLTGPESLDGDRMALALSDGLNTPVHYVNAPGGAQSCQAGNVSHDVDFLIKRQATPLSRWAQDNSQFFMEQASTTTLPPGLANQATNEQGQQTVNQQGQQGAIHQPDPNVYDQNRRHTPGIDTLHPVPCVSMYQRTPFPHLSGHTESWYV